MADTSKSVSQAAAALSRRGASKGGLTRAQRLGADQRKEIARGAAIARWGAGIQVATHVGELRIGNQVLACAVLEDGTRVINQATVLTVLGRHNETGRRRLGALPPFLDAANLKPFLSEELVNMLEPIPYRVPNGATRSSGYQAEMLPLVCEVYLEARRLSALVPSQRPVAAAAELLVRGLARVGIVALVDEATGYQETRARRELQHILEAYVQPELRPWTKMFPDEFFKQIYRLQGWEYRPGTAKRTQLVGLLINKYVYEQLPEGVLEGAETAQPSQPERQPPSPLPPVPDGRHGQPSPRQADLHRYDAHAHLVVQGRVQVSL